MRHLEGMMGIWGCKIGECDRKMLPKGADLPMRQAVAAEYERLTGLQPSFIFSGWGETLDEYQRACIENRDPDPSKVIDHQAALAEKDAEIAKLKHELKQDEYKFIRNHNDYYKELCGLRNQLAEKDELIAGLTKKVKNLTAWYDKMFGTPCEEIRHQQQIEQLQADLDRVMGEAVGFAGIIKSTRVWAADVEQAIQFLGNPLVRSWRARQGEETT